MMSGTKNSILAVRPYIQDRVPSAILKCYMDLELRLKIRDLIHDRKSTRITL